MPLRIAAKRLQIEENLNTEHNNIKCWLFGHISGDMNNLLAFSTSQSQRPEIGQNMSGHYATAPRWNVQIG